MKQFFFALVLISISAATFAQQIMGTFVFKVPNTTKALGVSAQKNNTLKLSPQSPTLNDVCTNCKSQQWRYNGSSIINISNGKYLSYNVDSKQLIMQSTLPQVVWYVSKLSNGKVKIELSRNGYLYTTNTEIKTNASPLLGYPCNTSPELCNVINWDIEEIESEISVPEYDFGTLCPSVLINGDREFNGNGPQISGSVSLSLANNNTELRATVVFEAIETGGDGSRTKQTWEKIIYTAPTGKKIASFTSTPQTSTFFFISVKAGFVADRLVKGDVMYTNFPQRGTNNEPLTISGNVVYKMEIIGDTAGDDISNDTNCNDDTRINKLILRSVGLRIVNL